MLLPTEKTLKFNDNDIKDDTVLNNEDKNELYRQIDLCDGFAKISSFSNDGLVESFELENKTFILGIKWHPELMLEDDVTQNLFSEFIKNCKTTC